MKLALDVTPIARGATGTSTYVAALIAARTRLYGEVPIGFTAGGGSAISIPGVRMATTAVPRRLLDSLWLTMGRDHVERFTGPLDVFHATDLLAPRTRSAAVVLTVHDLVWKTQPELADPRIASRLEQYFARSLDLADRIIAVSQATAEALGECFDVPRDRVTVVHHGVWPSFRPGPVDWKTMRDLGGRLEAGYVLAVGPVDRRKDLVTAVEAHRRLACELPLVIVGPDAGGEQELDAAIADSGSRVLRLGRVSERRLARLYRGARAVLYLSRAEGFGLPVLEAMASGVPVITSEIPVVAEVAGDTVLSVPAQDPDSLAEALARTLDGGSETQARVARALEIASTRSWERCATETEAVYRDAHEVRS